MQDLVLLFGGNCNERRVSVASAQHLSASLPRAHLWFWAPDGGVFAVSAEQLAAHSRPFETDFVPRGRPRFRSLSEALDETTPERTFVLALHGGAGEDGTVQAWMEERRLPFTGSGAAASRRAFDKVLAKECVQARGVRTAEAAVVSGADPRGTRRTLAALRARFGRVVVKPVADGSSAGLQFIDDESGIEQAVSQLGAAPDVPHLAEAFVTGVELTVGVVDDEGGPRALACSEVRVERGRAFDYAGKYLGAGTREITPAEIPSDLYAAACELAVAAHQATGCRGYSRTDLIAASVGPVFLEINSLPGLTRASFIPQQLAVAGISMERFLARQIVLARTRYVDAEKRVEQPPRTIAG